MASSEARESLAQAGMEAFNAGDMDRMLAALAGDIEVYASPEMANAGSFRGHDGFITWITAWTDAWEAISAEVTGTVLVGDRHIVTAIDQEGRGRRVFQDQHRAQRRDERLDEHADGRARHSGARDAGVLSAPP